MPMPRNTSNEFWDKVSVKNDEECWEWQKAKINGYGSFWVNNSQVRAHRYAWEHYHQQIIPEGLFVCHHCDNPSCCNPKHLFLGTHEDNMLDRKQKGRYNFPKGEDHYLTGKPRTLESREKQSQSMVGAKNHRFGCHLDQKTKDKIRQSLLGKKRSEESKQRQRETVALRKTFKEL